MIKINDEDITFVVQGDQRDTTVRLLLSVKEFFPNSTLVFSTTDSNIQDHIYSITENVIINPDPGSLPSYTKFDLARINNINRHIVSSKAGVSISKTKYTAKLRSDLELVNDSFIKLFEQIAEDNRLLVPSIFTRHPIGFNQYLFNVSDWFIFGKTENLIKLFDLELVSENDSCWFDTNLHKPKSSYAARRFRARFTPEQSLFIPYAKKYGYLTPDFFNDTNAKLIDSYTKFIAKELIVSDVDCLGLRLKKYEDKNTSFYQKIDCVSFSDWIDISEKTLLFNSGKLKPNLPLSIIRNFIKPFRRAIIYIVVKLF